MKNSFLDFNIVKSKIAESRISSFGTASIREIVKLVNQIEKATGMKYIRMEMGVPGLSSSPIGTEAEIDALKRVLLLFIRILKVSTL